MPYSWRSQPGHDAILTYIESTRILPPGHFPVDRLHAYAVAIFHFLSRSHSRGRYLQGTEYICSVVRAMDYMLTRSYLLLVRSMRLALGSAL